MAANTPTNAATAPRDAFPSPSGKRWTQLTSRAAEPACKEVDDQFDDGGQRELQFRTFRLSELYSSFGVAVPGRAVSSTEWPSGGWLLCGIRVRQQVDIKVTALAPAWCPQRRKLGCKSCVAARTPQDAVIEAARQHKPAEQICPDN